LKEYARMQVQPVLGTVRAEENNESSGWLAGL